MNDWQRQHVQLRHRTSQGCRVDHVALGMPSWKHEGLPTHHLEELMRKIQAINGSKGLLALMVGMFWMASQLNQFGEYAKPITGQTNGWPRRIPLSSTIQIPTGAQELPHNILPVNKIRDVQSYLVKSEISLQAGNPEKRADYLYFSGLLIFEFTALCCTGMHRVYFARMHAAK